MFDHKKRNIGKRDLILKGLSKGYELERKYYIKYGKKRGVISGSELSNTNYTRYPRPEFWG